jgi:hypothetical protein
MANKPDMRRVEATAFLKEIEKRDPCCMALFIAAMEGYQKLSPGITLKDFYTMVIMGSHDKILKMKKKEFLCPLLLSDGKMEAEKQSTTGDKTSIAA